VSTESASLVPYWHLWTDADGISHQWRCELIEFHKAPIQKWISAETVNQAMVL
jgi:hypothetical protein